MSSAVGLWWLNAEKPRGHGKRRRVLGDGWQVWDCTLATAGLDIGEQPASLSSGGASLAEVRASNFNFGGKAFKCLLQGYRYVNNSKLYNTFPKTGRGNVEKLIILRPCRLLLHRTLCSRSQINVGFPWAAIVPAARGCCLSHRSQPCSS